MDNKIIKELEARRQHFENEIKKIDAQIEDQKCQCENCHCHKNWNDLNAVKARLAELEAEAVAQAQAENAEQPVTE